jgi:hypothetical protein
VTTVNLLTVGKYPYNRARFALSVNGCYLTVDSPAYATGSTGTHTLALTASQQTCLRETFDCGTKLKVYWASCDTAECGLIGSGPMWEAVRPACTTNLPAAKPLSLRHTVAALGASGIDETWEVITP